jgi:hypothetical protein
MPVALHSSGAAILLHTCHAQVCGCAMQTRAGPPSGCIQTSGLRTFRARHTVLVHLNDPHPDSS